MNKKAPTPYTITDPFYRYHRDMLDIKHNTKK